MKVQLCPADATACGQYRMVYPALAARAAGDVAVSFSDRLRVKRDSRTWSIVDAVADADVVVLQRPAARDTVDAIAHLQRRGIAVVVEMDDDFSTLHPRSSIFAEMHPSNPDVNWHHIKRACNLADLVTVTTPALAARYGGPKARVLANRVPKALLDVRAERDGRTVGWGGRTDTHVDDLKATRGGVAMAIDDTGARFLTVGPPDGVRRDLRLSSDPDTTGGLPFQEYHPALARLDVGIAPLADTAFNAAKSALKLLEYSALGIACVASPAPEYRRMRDAGIGLVADRSREWRRLIRKLLEDQPFREDTAASARELVKAEHTYEQNAWQWAECWQEAIDIRNSAKVVAAA